MSKFTKITKNPMTWFLFILACGVGLILWIWKTIRGKE